MNNAKKQFFIGLDVGTDSVGYAVTDKNYKLLKFKREPMWGVHLFEEAKLNDERRNFRTARRILERRKQRIKLLQDLFAKEIAKKDKKFFIRIKESSLYPEDSSCGASLFNDIDLNDRIYNTKYPTIHHLICELIDNKEPHDIRLLYLACAWLIGHRGHFLNEISTDNMEEILDINNIYHDFMEYFNEEKPWSCEDTQAFGNVLQQNIGVSKKYKEICLLLYGTPKVPKDEEYIYDKEAILKLLCGGKVAPKQLFKNEDYSDIDSFSLDKADDELAPILSELGDDSELILRIKKLFDWGVLNDVLQGHQYISKAKVEVYNQHKTDLKNLKKLIKTYHPDKYNEMFRLSDTGKVNYEAYAKGNSGKQEDFCKYTKSLLKDVVPAVKDKAIFDKVMEKLETQSLCPKQVNSDNRVIPNQIYLFELKAILKNASKYHTFLNDVSDGITVLEKILSIFEFRIPYFVGPLNTKSKFAWIQRKDGPIYPWNFNEIVDLEASEQAFIDNMTNNCTYLPNASVLPKMSLCYEKFQLLNEINTISVNGRRISPELKQKMFLELFMNRKKITKKAIKSFLISNGYSSSDIETLSGIDDTIKSSLCSHIAFNNLLGSNQITKNDIERIINQRTYTESKYRFSLWLSKEYPNLSDIDQKYICSLKLKDFGRLSHEFLCELYGTETNSETGEAKSILQRMWEENLNLMEILSEEYTYSKQIESVRAEYYQSNKKSIEDRLDEMYISNAVKRPIIRTLDIVSDIVKASGNTPEKIFIEMARGGKAEDKGKRTKSRLSRIKELYEKCDTEDARVLNEELEKMGAQAENKLQSDKLFLYYMQLGKCMYTGEPISLSQLSTKLYDIDHIYPQSKVADDSIHNNKVLVLSTANGEKGDVYPIKSQIRQNMKKWWEYLKNKELISEEKFKRLTRSEPFSEAEQWGFINRQLVETRQSTKALATILSEIYPESRIVYVKAGIVSEFRQQFDMLKSRSVNDLHHAKDAYLNIVVGNVYNERFTKKWFLDNKDSYNLKIKTLFGHSVTANGSLVWDGAASISQVKNVIHKKNAVHLTRYAFCRKGSFFDQMPVSAAKGLVPLKKGLPTEKYGGYNKTTASFFILAKYVAGKKNEKMIMPVELLYADKVISDLEYAEEYAKKTIGEIINKEIVSVSFPLGLRKIKIGTILEFDGCFRAYITGKSSGGKKIGISTLQALIVGYDWEKYIKRLERFVEKKKKNPSMIYSELHDEVTTQKNLELYDILTLKLSETSYKKRPANPYETMINGREKFIQSNIFEQAVCLSQVLLIFSRISGCDLSRINGAPKSAVSCLSSFISNWMKNYSDVRIVDVSSSGLYTSKTDNLLDLL